jgi:hypothetical protein
MPYVNGDGTVVESQSWLRLSIFSDLFWTVFNTVGLFFSSLINPGAPLPTERDASQYNRLSNTSFSSSSTTTNKPKGPAANNGGNNNPPRPFGAKVAKLPKPCNTGR